MKKSIVVFGVIISCAFFAAATAGAHWPGSRGNGGCRASGETETFRGEVAAVKEFGRQGVGLELNTGSSTVFVHLGPSFYIKEQPVSIAAGDSVEITGAKSFRRGSEIFIADQVKKGNEVLKLRDPNGVPLWAGTAPEERGFNR